MRVLAFDEEARAFGLAEPRGMLVCGVQGCGKSLVSKAAARVLGLPLVRLDFADVFAMPSPEQALREAMRVTEALAPAGALGRRDREGSRRRHAGRRAGARLWRVLDVASGATSRSCSSRPRPTRSSACLLSSSRRGRFDEIFFVDLPSAKERQDILRLQLAAARPRSGEVRGRSRSARSSSTSPAPSSSRSSRAPSSAPTRTSAS